MANKSVSEIQNRVEKALDNNLSAFRITNNDGVALENVIVSDQDLSSEALSFTTTESSPFKIAYINFNFSTAVTQTITITKLTGIANKDEILEKQELTANTSARFVSIANILIDPTIGEQLEISVTNTGTPSSTIYTTLKIERV